MSLSLSQRLDSKFKLLDRFLCAFGITDEIFAVCISNKEKITRNYMLGLILLPYIGWATGTISGALLGDVLPSFIVSALSIALFAMFIAIIIPATMSNHKILPVILISAGLSCLFYYIPVLNTVSPGITYIICAVIASVIGAILFPIKESEKDE